MADIIKKYGLDPKFKGKSFAAISKNILKQYENRTDPISLRGLKDQMRRLRLAQDEVRSLRQSMNAGLVTDALNKSQLAYGGEIEPIDPRARLQASISNALANQKPIINSETLPQTKSKAQEENINPLRLAPIVGNLLNFATTGKPEVQQERQVTASPRQSTFRDIDLSPIERAIASQGRQFTRTNVDASGGNVGALMANELASQGNQLGAISNANLAVQQANTNVDQLRAGEQARIDQFNLGKDERNTQFGLFTDDINARNRGVNKSNKQAALSQVFTDIGNIGKEKQLSDMISGATGYTQSGNYVGTGNSAAPLLNYLIGGFLKNKQGI